MTTQKSSNTLLDIFIKISKIKYPLPNNYPLRNLKTFYISLEYSRNNILKRFSKFKVNTAL